MPLDNGVDPPIHIRESEDGNASMLDPPSVPNFEFTYRYLTDMRVTIYPKLPTISPCFPSFTPSYPRFTLFTLI